MKRRTIGLALGLSLVAGFAAAWSGPGSKVTLVHGVEWLASFEDAKIEAKRTGKPILLLSMFGRLDEEMACANARTLRATLFKDPRFQELVKKDVIPAWEMVRAVPKVEIDLGDGKKIRRTVRGNAVIYLCNPEGLVVDAFPGVYTPEDFLPAFKESLALLAHADWSTVREYHGRPRARVLPTRATLGKAAMESPTLDLIGAPPIAGAVTSETSSDPARLRFLEAASRLTDFSLTPLPATTVIETLGLQPVGSNPEKLAQDIIRLDSRNNMERVRPVVHLWLASEKTFPTPEQARNAVLETILKIPYKDPYFGLKDVILPGTPD